MTEQTIPDVCFDADLARIFKTSERSIRRQRHQRTWPIPTLPAIDRKPRTSGVDVRRFLNRELPGMALVRRRSA